jgi:hypothetical protein
MYVFISVQVPVPTINHTITDVPIPLIETAENSILLEFYEFKIRSKDKPVEVDYARENSFTIIL